MVDPIPKGVQKVMPHLVVRSASDAIAFYKKAFGATERVRHMMPDRDKIMHAEIQIGDTTVALVDEMPMMDYCVSPQQLNGTTATMHLWSADVDADFARAVKAGAVVVIALEDTFWGARYGTLRDPFGHHWSLSMQTKEMTPEEVAQAADDYFNFADVTEDEGE